MLMSHFYSSVKRDKLDKKAKANIFVGYNNVTKGYRMYQPQTEKVIVSRDIKFIETDKWNLKDVEKKSK